MKHIPRVMTLVGLFLMISVSGYAQEKAPERLAVEPQQPVAVPETPLRQLNRLSIGPRVGTLGPGLELGLRPFQPINLRVTGNYFKHNFNGTYDDIKYDVDVTWTTGGALVDIHPFPLGFRFTLGAFANHNRIDLQAEPDIAYVIGNQVYDGADLASITGDVSFDPIAPYFGLGWGSSGYSRIYFSVDVGLMYQGSAKVRLDATGIATTYAGFYEELERERQNIEDDIDEHKWYPVVMIGFGFSF